MAAKIPPLHVLRGILRRIKVNNVKNSTTDILNTASTQSDKNVTRASATSKYVVARYRKQVEQDIPDNKTNRELHKLAYEYLSLREDIDERSRLQLLDTGAENQLSPKEMSRRAAARAGLQLPQLDPTLK